VVLASDEAARDIGQEVCIGDVATGGQVAPPRQLAILRVFRRVGALMTGSGRAKKSRSSTPAEMQKAMLFRSTGACSRINAYGFFAVLLL